MKKFVKSVKRRRIALLVESSRAYGRGILSGVARFVREHCEENQPNITLFAGLWLAGHAVEATPHGRGGQRHQPGFASASGCDRLTARQPAYSDSLKASTW